jgi:hypothetical protein
MDRFHRSQVLNQLFILLLKLTTVNDHHGMCDENILMNPFYILTAPTLIHAVGDVLS